MPPLFLAALLPLIMPPLRAAADTRRDIFIFLLLLRCRYAFATCRIAYADAAMFRRRCR